MNAACKQLRKDILNISFSSGHGHIPTCFSVIEMLSAIYDTMRHDPKRPTWDGRDLFVLSKGHAALSHYCVLARRGYFDIEAVSAFGAAGSTFGCHADRTKIPGIEASTGSLGHGIGIAAGMALASKIKKDGRRAYTIIGDGESNEGSVWEAIMVAANLKLDNFTVLYDNNMSHARGLQIHGPAERFAAFGCHTIEVGGHDIAALKAALEVPATNVKVIVCNTEKGHGCATLMKDQYAWHRRSPNAAELAILTEELDA